MNGTVQILPTWLGVALAVAGIVVSVAIAGIVVAIKYRRHG